jgi:K+-transporting ATPase ATPase B chain
MTRSAEASARRSSRARNRSIWDLAIVRGAVLDALRKLDPRTMLKNPVMFVVEAGSMLTTIRLVADAVAGRPDLGFELQITVWLWLTVLFANFAEAMAEGRGKAQADTLWRARTQTMATRLAPSTRSRTSAHPAHEPCSSRACTSPAGCAPTAGAKSR